MLTNQKIYFKYCNKCRKKTKCFIEHIHRRNGVRTRCLNCGAVAQRYCNLKTLKEIKEEDKR